MKLYLNMSKPVTVITKNETPYSVDGNSGITYRIIVMAGDDVEKIKCVTKEVYDSINPGDVGLLSGEVDIRNAKCSEFKVNGLIRNNK